MLILAYVLIAVFFASLCGGFAQTIAKAKGYDQVTWFFAGFFFSLVALIAIAGLPMRNEDLREQTPTE